MNLLFCRDVFIVTSNIFCIFGTLGDHNKGLRDSNNRDCPIKGLPGISRDFNKTFAGSFSTGGLHSGACSLCNSVASVVQYHS